MIPIYRAKMINSDEYVIGFLIDTNKILEYCPAPSGMGTLQCVEDRHYFKIDPTTLAIHFPDMLDSQGNKIFASLSEDGKGGDICEINVIDAFLEKDYNIKSPILITQKGLKPMEYLGFANFKIIKVIGI